MITSFCYIVWNIEPEIFSFLRLPRWYGVMWGIGIFLSFEFMRYVYRSEDKNDKQFSGLAVYIILGTLIGARIGHILFYDPIFYLNNPWELLPFRYNDGFELTGIGGLASHGGTIGILISVGLYCKKHNLNYLWVADRLTIVGALCGGFIRIGNLFNSEIYGLPTSVPWAFVFARVDLYPRHPTQIYEAIFYFILFFAFLYLYKKGHFENYRGKMSGLFLVVVFTFRFFIEFLKVDQETISYGVALNAGQLLSLPLIVVGIVLLFFQKYSLKTNL